MCFRLYHAIIVRYRLACWQTFTYAICLPSLASLVSSLGAQDLGYVFVPSACAT